MDRRAFLTGLIGVAGAASLAGMTQRADAAPLARTLGARPEPDREIAGQAERQTGRMQAPDGTPVDEAQYGHYWRRSRRWRRRRRHWWRRSRRWDRRGRLVCRRVWRRGRWRRICRRVWY